FSTGNPWEPAQADWKTKNVAAQDSTPQSLLNHYRKLIQLRNAHRALSSGFLTLLQTNDTTGTIAAWLRSARDTAFLIVVNFGARHGELLFERLPMNSLPRGGNYRMEPAYADPYNACAQSFFGYELDNGNAAIQIKAVEAHGFCALGFGRR
ncbi:MAG TPA: hypothetical protein VF856_00330, partial [Gemmatimonadaceae bacterium]